MKLCLYASARRPSSDRASVSALLAAAVMAVLAALAAPATAQLQFAELAKQGLPPNADAEATALGDVDGDGDLDLVVGSFGQTRLYLNNGTGTFTDATATHLPVGNYNTISLAFGDVDGDGDLDLVVGNGGSHPGEQSRLYLNNSTGTFTDATATRMPLGLCTTTSLALGDVDGDGDLDLVLGNSGFWVQGLHPSRLYLNDGQGTFTDVTAMRMPVGGHETTSLALGDVDGDGDLDMVLGNTGWWAAGLNPSRLYMNDGTGTFTDATFTRMPVRYGTYSLALGDVDGDGDLDLVLGCGGAAWPGVGGSRDLYLNNGTGYFTDVTATRMPGINESTTRLALGDVDGDGDLDLIVGNSLAQPCRLYLNSGTGTFTDATATRMPAGIDFIFSLVLGDVDGDSDLDLVLVSAGQLRLCLNHNMGTFIDPMPVRMPLGSTTAALALGDVDSDGDLDMVLGGRLYLNNGTGTFTEATATHMPGGGGATSLALGDVDSDGDLDLVAGNGGYYSGGQSRLYLNNGTGTFTDATATRMPTGLYNTTSLALGDVDGDGDLDLAVGNGGLSSGGKYPTWIAEQSRLYLNNGTGTFTDATATQVPSHLDFSTSLAFGDVDGDGDLDLVVGNGGYYSGGQSRLYLNNGTGTFTDATATRMPTGLYNTTSLALGDPDSDGDLDLVVGNGGQSRLYLNNGTGTFTDATATRMPVGLYNTTSLALGDPDSDGDLDLVVGNGGQSRLYLNNGTGTFTDATATRMPIGTYSTSSLALGDVDSDGDLDVVLGNLDRQSRLYLNLGRQLDAPFVLHVGHTYQLDVYSRYGPTTQFEIAFPYFSTATAHIPVPTLGTIGIDPNLMIALPPFVVPQPAGIGSLLIPVPNVPALAGLTIYTQALLQQYPVQLRLTNVVADVIIQ